MKNVATNTSLVLALLLATACGGSSADAEIASLMPKDCVAFARIASIDQLLQNARDVAAGVGENTQSINADTLLQQLEGSGGKTALIDRTRPIAIAVSMPRATQPSAVVLVPATDAKAYAASLPKMAVAAVVSGGYVAVPLGAKYEKAGSPPLLMNNLPKGVLALRADAEQLAAAFGPVIGTSLSAFKAQMARELASGASGLDGEAVAEGYVSVIRSVLGAAKTLELTVDYRDGRLDAFATLAVKPGSELDGWGSAPLDLKGLTGRLSGKGSFEVLMGADWNKLLPRFRPLMEGALEIYPQQMRELLQPLLADYENLYRALGPIAAADGEILGANGMNVMLHLAPPDAADLQRQWETMFAHEAITKLGFSIGPAKTAEVGGASIRDYELKFDLDKLTASFGGAVKETERDSLEKVMRLMFGSGHVPVRLATKGSRSVIAVGPQKDHAATMASLDGTAGTWSKQVQSALARVGDCNPVLIERFDIGAIMAAMARVAPNQAMPPVPAGASADFLIAAGVHGNEWRAGLVIDVTGLAKMVKAMMPR